MDYTSAQDIEKERLFNERMNTSGFILHASAIKYLVDIYSIFMKSSKSIEINNSRIKQVIQTHDGRILFFTMNIKWFKDMNKMPISMNLKTDKKLIQRLSNLCVGTNDRIGVTDCVSSYCFSNLNIDANIPKSPKSNKQGPILKNRSYINYKFDSSDVNSVLGAFKNEDIIKKIRKVFDSTKPVEILICKQKIIAFKQDGIVVNTNYFGINVSESDVDLILRSYNLLYFNQKEPLNEKMKIIYSRDDEDKYWLVTSSVYWKAATKFKVYEELEVVDFG